MLEFGIDELLDNYGRDDSEYNQPDPVVLPRSFRTCEQKDSQGRIRRYCRLDQMLLPLHIPFIKLPVLKHEVMRSRRTSVPMLVGLRASPPSYAEPSSRHRWSSI